MKTITVLIFILSIGISSSTAQSAYQYSDKPVSQVKPAENSHVAKAPSDNKHQGRWASKEEQRRHAEKMSKGHAFSGKGKGGDKNISKPENKHKSKGKKKGEGKGKPQPPAKEEKQSGGTNGVPPSGKG